MNHLDLFSGIGGFSLAAQRIWGKEHNIIAFIEQDKYCQKILNKHWPLVPIFDDIKEFDGKKYRGTINLLTGGFPCQPFSVAGKQRGEEDDRYLWHEMARIIQETKPTWIIGENVTGIVNMAQLHSLPNLESEEYYYLEEGETCDIEGSGYLETILVEIEEMGYDVETFIIPACSVDARHRRDRIWIVCHSEYNGQFTTKIKRSIDKRSNNCKAKQEQAGKFEGSDIKYTDVADTKEERLQRIRPDREQITEVYGGKELSLCNSSNETIWPVEPDVGRVANGISSRVDRIKGLGNAIVPQVAEQIMRGIKELID